VSKHSTPHFHERSKSRNKTESKVRSRSWTIDDLVSWEREFLGRCSEDTVALRAWSKLCEAGLEMVSKRLLWEYSLTSNELIADLKRDMDKMPENLKSLSRALREASDQSSGARPDMFVRRANAKMEIVRGTRWPFRAPNTKTLADAATKYPHIGDLPIDSAASRMSKSGDAVRRHGGKILIAILQAGARISSVSLSPNELAALAASATPHRSPDARSLRRFLKLPAILAAEPEYRALFAQARTAIESRSL
jgi:hypothetical protein